MGIVLGSIISGVVTAVVAYIIVYVQFKKQRIFINKEERYQNLILQLNAFYRKNKSVDEKKEFVEGMKNCLQEYYKAWLYADAKVLINLKKLIDASMKSINLSEEEEKKILTEIITIFRKDLGISSTGFSDDFFMYYEERKGENDTAI